MSDPHGRRPFPWEIGAESKAPSRPTSVSLVPSSRLTSCARPSFAALALRFRAWVSKMASASSHDQGRSKNVFASLSKKKTCNTCAVCRSLSTSCNCFSVTGFLPQRNALRPRCLSRDSALAFWRACCRWQHYLQYGQFCAASTLFGVVSRSFRLLAALSGHEPEANMWHFILVWRRHRSFGGHKCGVRLRAIDDGR